MTITADQPGSLDGPVAGSTEELVSCWTPRALALARRIVKDDGLAEDVVQEAFLAHWRNPASFDPERGSFGTWLLAMVHHKAVDAVRREESQRRRVDVLAKGAAEPEVGRDLADEVSDRMGALPVRRALEGLPAPQREAIVLAYWGGYTQRQIAERTGVPLGTVKTRMLAGMRRLHQALPGALPPPIPAPATPASAG
ncbi:sigma-70 family RNA polymerase sigma factor [Blastococcus sp. CT_GayMR16]|uniref:sigma-70 family RNA polymerase sigma factor n=1 Tax=Blastococcus sp. CT_GayMR16 TaxID=2559607 RepID=UPI001FD7762C|nr:sigma-70 family RNA polymerase sigma factor [Blastococcus sp. CT_GayMR16]